MFRPRINHIAATASVLLAGTWACAAQQPDVSELQAMVQDLRTKNADLERSLVQANRNEKEASEKLARVEQRLAALGRNLLDGGDDRLVQATSDLQVMSARVTSLEGAASRLAANIADYLRQAVAADPDSRLRVETAIRELDEVLGLGQKPAPTAPGNAGQAKVVSIDAESGLLVMNVGESQNVRIGTAYQLARGNQPLGTAIIADVRRNVCGAFVEQLDPAAGQVRLGDTAILITQPSR